MAITIQTPAGKRVTINQYIALVNRNECSCEHGHLSCGAWENGPCMDELMSEQEADFDPENIYGSASIRQSIEQDRK